MPLVRSHGDLQACFGPRAEQRIKGCRVSGRGTSARRRRRIRSRLSKRHISKQRRQITMDLAVPRCIGRLQYAAARRPFILLDEWVVARYWGQDAPARVGFERWLGSLDVSAGRLVADEGISRRGQALMRQTRDPEWVGGPALDAPVQPAHFGQVPPDRQAEVLQADEQAPDIQRADEQAPEILPAGEQAPGILPAGEQAPGMHDQIAAYQEQNDPRQLQQAADGQVTTGSAPPAADEAGISDAAGAARPARHAGNSGRSGWRSRCHVCSSCRRQRRHRGVVRGVQRLVGRGYLARTRQRWVPAGHRRARAAPQLPLPVPAGWPTLGERQAGRPLCAQCSRQRRFRGIRRMTSTRQPGAAGGATRCLIGAACQHSSGPRPCWRGRGRQTAPRAPRTGHRISKS